MFIGVKVPQTRQVCRDFKDLPLSEVQKLIDSLANNTIGGRWITATENSFDASVVQLHTGRPALAMGGFDGNVSIVSNDILAQFLSNGDVKYFVSSQPLSLSQLRPMHKWVVDNMKHCKIAGSWHVYSVSLDKCEELKQPVSGSKMAL